MDAPFDKVSPFQRNDLSDWRRRGFGRMQLSEALRLVRKVDPEAIMHRDHICSESVAHDLARCPKMLSQIYAWRVESNTLPKPISRVQSAREFRQGSRHFETARPNTAGTRE
jgi:hypothetical protein